VTDLVRDDALEAELRAIAKLLARIEAPAPPTALVARTLRVASAELGRPPALAPGVAAACEELPLGFRRELARLVAATLPALALVLGWDVFLLRQGAPWLAGWLPARLAFVLVAAHVAAGLGFLALAYASLPLFAYRRTLLRVRSANP
jgi:hypothetical protein